jgi:transposase
MLSTDHQPQDSIRTDLRAIFVSLELSRSTWLITSLSPGAGNKISKHCVSGGDIAGLLRRFGEFTQKAKAKTQKAYPIIVIQEAGLDGFWIHRRLQSEGIESYVVDPASIATARRRRRAKTDKLDGEALLRALMAFKRGEPRVCAMINAPTPEEEDRRRISRERKTLINERIRHVNRIKGLLFSQGIRNYDPLRAKRRERLQELRTGDGRVLPDYLKRQIGRELDRLELLLKQIAAAEAERDALISAEQEEGNAKLPAAMLMDLRGIGAESASAIWLEGLFRHFQNRRQIAAYAGLAPTPWQSGTINREQGISKAGNPRLRTTMIQLSWLWLKHQPQSTMALWFKERVSSERGRIRRVMIVGLARKLLIALWQFVTKGVIPEGAVMRTA